MDNVLAKLQTEQDDPRIQMDYDYELLLNNTQREKIIANVKRRFEGGECVVPPSLPNTEACLGKEAIRDVSLQPVDCRSPSSVARIHHQSCRPPLPKETLWDSEAYDRLCHFRALPSNSNAEGYFIIDRTTARYLQPRFAKREACHVDPDQGCSGFVRRASGGSRRGPFIISGKYSIFYISKPAVKLHWSFQQPRATIGYNSSRRRFKKR